MKSPLDISLNPPRTLLLSDTPQPGQIPNLLPHEAEALSFILPLSSDYPGIERWYRTKVVPGLRTGERYLHRVERGGELVGVGIAKKDSNEKKICTVRVSHDHFGRGIGVRIFDNLLRWLNEDRPHLTVSESKLPNFERIFDWYGFSSTSANSGLYVPGRLEIGYNENIQEENEDRVQSQLTALRTIVK
ncbi:GNAT family N-acetyltransferase [Rhizobium lusitanum]|uniref:Acetyltransferase (GNAT) family protein n=1 Tax=Rhizobium lusitanum TaxID=293958 RepID=A0A1C3XL82_9HYPH|nr:GNAT family N-acetyltransferase [Rhizobium lusitanum]SCB53010.1 Acetyltransferase (GNAT) family protein [Rhizobium lusitanum]